MVDVLKPALDLVARLGADHADLQPDARTVIIPVCIPLLEGWRRLADQAGVAGHVETRRDCMAADLLFTLQLLDCFPNLRLTACRSHHLIGREFAWPVGAVNHALIHRILDNALGLMAVSPAGSRCRSRRDFRSTRAGSSCSWAGGSTPCGPGAAPGPTPR